MITDFNCQKEQTWTLLQGQQMKASVQGSHTTSLYTVATVPTQCVCAACLLSIDSHHRALHWIYFWDSSANALTAFLLNCEALMCVIVCCHWCAVCWGVVCVWGSKTLPLQWRILVLFVWGRYIILAYLVSKSLLVLFAVSKIKSHFNYV